MAFFRDALRFTVVEDTPLGDGKWWVRVAPAGTTGTALLLAKAATPEQQQRNITESELSITVQSNQGKAEYARALQQAAQIRALAEAEAEKTARIGIGQAIAIEEQVAAYGGPQFQVTQQVMSRWAEAVQQSKAPVVPQVVVSGGGGAATSSSVMEGLLTLLLSEKLGMEVTGSPQREANPLADQLRAQIREGLKESRQGESGPVPPAPAPSSPPEGTPA